MELWEKKNGTLNILEQFNLNILMKSGHFAGPFLHSPPLTALKLPPCIPSVSCALGVDKQVNLEAYKTRTWGPCAHSHKKRVFFMCFAQITQILYGLYVFFICFICFYMFLLECFAGIFESPYRTMHFNAAEMVFAATIGLKGLRTSLSETSIHESKA